MKAFEPKDSVIFRGLSEKEVGTAMQRLNSFEKPYRKGSYILRTGSTTDSMGLVLEGSVTIENLDLWGNRTILSHVGRGEFFAETYGFLSGTPLLVDVVANESCRILFLRVGMLRETHAKNESWMGKLTTNLLAISTQKNLILSQRSFHTSPKTIRGRVMAYLNSIAIQIRKTEFDIPFDRAQMADYLNVDRSALSKELSKMKEDGLIDYRKRHFRLAGHF